MYNKQWNCDTFCASIPTFQTSKVVMLARNPECKPRLSGRVSLTFKLIFSLHGSVIQEFHLVPTIVTRPRAL